MARVYKIHFYYGVVWSDKDRGRYFYRTFMTLREARKFANLLRATNEYYEVDVIRRLNAWNMRHGDIHVEEV